MTMCDLSPDAVGFKLQVRTGNNSKSMELNNNIIIIIIIILNILL